MRLPPKPLNERESREETARSVWSTLTPTVQSEVVGALTAMVALLLASSKEESDD